MAESVWWGLDSGNEGNYNTAANWTNGVPGAGDDGIFLSGSQSVTTGPAGTPTIANLWVGGDFIGNGGSADAYMIFGQITGSVTIIGPGKWYLDISGAAGPTNGVTVRQPSSTGGLWIKTGTGATDLDVLVLERGRVTHTDGEIAKVVEDHRVDLKGDSYFILDGGIVDMCHKEGGRLDLESGTLTAIDSFEGEIYINGGTVVTAEIKNTYMEWSTTATITLIHVHSGAYFDCSKDPRARTITEGYTYGTGRMNLDNGRGNITETADVVEYGIFAVERFSV